MVRKAFLALCMFAGVASADIVAYEGHPFPEECGFERAGTFDAERWLADGRFCHHVELGQWDPPPYGEADYHRWDLPSFVDAPFFIEWRVISDAPNSEVDHQNGASLIVLVGGPVTYHFNVASGLARLIRGYQFEELYFEIDPGVPHTYRLEVFGGEWFEFRIDGALVAADVPEDIFPTSDALMSWGTRYYLAESTAQWEYVRFGTIAQDGSGDYDSDGNVDFRDLYFFKDYFSGPDVDAGPGARWADFDGDTDVDCDDWEAFQLAWTDPADPPIFFRCYPDPIPTISDWGIVIMMLLVLSAGTIVFRRHGASPFPAAIQ